MSWLNKLKAIVAASSLHCVCYLFVSGILLDALVGEVND